MVLNNWLHCQHLRTIQSFSLIIRNTLNEAIERCLDNQCINLALFRLNMPTSAAYITVNAIVRCEGVANYPGVLCSYRLNEAPRFAFLCN